jgi:hypothetical protein
MLRSSQYGCKIAVVIALVTNNARVAVNIDDDHAVTGPSNFSLSFTIPLFAIFVFDRRHSPCGSI